jgi:hypothetical protein
MNGLSPIAGSLPISAITPPQCLQLGGSSSSTREVIGVITSHDVVTNQFIP